MKKLVIFGVGEIGKLSYYYFTHDSNYKVVAFTVDKQFIKQEKFCDLPLIEFEKVEEIINKHTILEKELSSGEIDPKLFAKKSKEYSRIGNIIETARSYVNFENEKKDLENIISDTKNDVEIIEMAKKDLEDLKQKNVIFENKLKIFLLPKDEDDDKNAIVEIRAGTGGLEASLFCSDLFKMYEKVCSKKKWQLEIINISKSDAGGFKEVIFSVYGNDIYSYLKYESY